MTLNFPETDSARPAYVSPPIETGETIVPVYARKPAKSSTKKKLLWVIPAVLGLGIGAWALTLGEQKSDDTVVAEADTDSLTTSRLSQMESPAASEPSMVSATPVADAPPLAAPVTAPAPAPKLRPAPAARTSSTTITRRASAPAPAPTKARPLPQETISPPAAGPVLTPAPAPVVVPTPTLPAEPAPQAVPPATTTPPGGL